jgi:outer membrane protein assembly factor BamB
MSRVPAVIVALAALGIGYVRLVSEQTAQAKTLATFGIVVLTSLLLLLWFLFASGRPRRARLGVLAAVVAGMAAFFALVRVRGVTGDFIPVLEPRWRPKEGAIAPPRPPPPTTIATAPSSAPAAPAAATPQTRTAPPRAATLNDYPQFLGPNRDGTLGGFRLARDWDKRPPRLLWRQPVGLGWSAFAIAGSRAITQEQRGGEEVVAAYDLVSGRPLWVHADRVRFDSVIAGDGPRAVPTIDGGRVFSVGSTGLLNALDAETGRTLWSHDIVKENGAIVPDFGKVTAPLVVGERVVVSAGGPGGRSLVAYEKDTGELAWSTGDDRSGYGSPALLTLLGRPQLLSFNAGSVTAHEPASGRVLWTHAWPPAQPNVAPPLPVATDRVLLSAGYGVGSKLFEIAPAGDAYQARVLWESPRLKAKFVNMVLLDGFVYGLDDGILACLDPATGERKWKAGRYGHGQMILVDRTLLVQTEEGELVLVEPNPEGLKELARFDALGAKTWNPPALAAPYLLVRNDKEAACYELPIER